jgi:hypothetical protein
MRNPDGWNLRKKDVLERSTMFGTMEVDEMRLRMKCILLQLYFNGKYDESATIMDLKLKAEPIDL